MKLLIWNAFSEHPMTGDKELACAPVGSCALPLESAWPSCLLTFYAARPPISHPLHASPPTLHVPFLAFFFFFFFLLLSSFFFFFFLFFVSFCFIFFFLSLSLFCNVSAASSPELQNRNDLRAETLAWHVILASHSTFLKGLGGLRGLALVWI